MRNSVICNLIKYYSAFYKPRINEATYWCFSGVQGKPVGRIRNGEVRMRISEQTLGSMGRSAFMWMSWSLMPQNPYGGREHCSTPLLQIVCFYLRISHPFHTIHLLHFISRLLLHFSK